MWLKIHYSSFLNLFTKIVPNTWCASQFEKLLKCGIIQLKVSLERKNKFSFATNNQRKFVFRSNWFYCFNLIGTAEGIENAIGFLKCKMIPYPSLLFLSRRWVLLFLAGSREKYIENRKWLVDKGDDRERNFER